MKTATRPLAKLPVALTACANQATIYGQCVASKYADTSKGMCEEQFRAFSKCVAEAMKRK